MTCDEFHAAYAQNPLHLTRATRAAFLGHLKTCATCAAWWAEEGERLKARMKANPVATALLGVVAVDLMTTDNQDPEFREAKQGGKPDGE